ncbi:hypothetical protein [Pedobacter caeni]|uniref:Uncharacterized protein n=1 Tax=Pedobacter caeni TaxID=288992 RepID=A0A1M4V498_9SPHI|nr:hypothetical protein [Pedobacter caeni]SHE63804.1 hypothetical protein SAMN04488522_101773 [Pedobacter caeni]
MPVKFTLFLIALVVQLSAKAQDKTDVKIYSVRDTTVLWDKKYKSEIYWAFCKIDGNEKTIQSSGFNFRDGDKGPDLTDLSHLFKDEDKDWFVVLSPVKLKVKRVKGTRTKRAWNDFATAGRTAGSPAKIFFINGDTLSMKGGSLKLVLDKELTSRYHSF